MAELAIGNGTREAVISRILQARTINEAFGGAVVGPGDLDGLQDDLINACYAIVNDLPRRIRDLHGHK